ncbi:MAG: SIS domain-containing protein [Bacteroidales bacterium]|nr:SIS domain-containing protein [Bacteroidales bacterium]
MNPFLKEIKGQSKALSDTARNIVGCGVLKDINEMWRRRASEFKGLILTGMGSSDFIASAGAALLQAKGICATYINAGELLHYGPDSLDEYLTVCISQSGESYEIVRLLPRLGTVIAITNEPGSTLAKAAEYRMVTTAGKEEMTSTKTFVTCWQAMLLLCKALTGSEEFGFSWEDVASCVEKALGCDVSKAVALIGDSSFLQIVGRGPVMAAVSQSALMWMEAAHIPASSMCGGNFRHGPLEMVKEGMTVVVFTHSLSRTYSQSLRLCGDILRYGGNVVLVSDKKGMPEDSPRLVQIAVPCSGELLLPILGVIPLQLMVNDWACAHGMTPGDFAHGAKVTVTE